MKFNVKAFAMFFVAIIIGTLGGGYVNAILGLSSGADIFTYIVFMIVPVLISYLLYENYLRKQNI